MEGGHRGEQAIVTLDADNLRGSVRWSTPPRNTPQAEVNRDLSPRLSGVGIPATPCHIFVWMGLVARSSRISEGSLQRRSAMRERDIMKSHLSTTISLHSLRHAAVASALLLMLQACAAHDGAYTTGTLWTPFPEIPREVVIVALGDSPHGCRWNRIAQWREGGAEIYIRSLTLNKSDSHDLRVEMYAPYLSSGSYQLENLDAQICIDPSSTPISRPRPSAMTVLTPLSSEPDIVRISEPTVDNLLSYASERDAYMMTWTLKIPKTRFGEGTPYCDVTTIFRTAALAPNLKDPRQFTVSMSMPCPIVEN